MRPSASAAPAPPGPARPRATSSLVASGRGTATGSIRRAAAPGAAGPLILKRGAPIDWLIVGLGNPGRAYDGTRHNIGFAVADELARRWDLGRPSTRFAGRLREGRTGPGGPRVALLEPQTFMNDAGRSVGPARGSLHAPLDRVLVVHDEIDLPFGEIRSRLGGGLAGHNGLKSLRRELGGPDFARVRVGVGRPDSTDPEIVSAHVLGRFAEPAADVAQLVERAADTVAAIVSGERPL